MRLLSREHLLTSATALCVRFLVPASTGLIVPDAAHAAVKFSNGAEEIRKAASLIPGYGPPDISYPPVFLGRWRVESRMVNVTTPLGEDVAPMDHLRTARQLMAAERPLSFEQRFVEAEGGASGVVLVRENTDSLALSVKNYGGGMVIAERAFNAEHRAAAQPGAGPLQDFTARWEPTNPNVLTLASRGTVVETKVTKRSFQQPFDGAFGTSEYARIADAGSEGVLGGVPNIKASRVQIKYKWDGASPIVIEAIELTQVFDPTQTGFADLAGATPVLTTKARLLFTRLQLTETQTR